MKTCPVCGNEVQDGYRFCTHCGTELAKKEEEGVRQVPSVEEAASTIKEAVRPAPGVEEGKASTEKQEKKTNKVHFFIGFIAFLLVVGASFFAFGKVFHSLGGQFGLSRGQKFLKMQTDHLQSRLKAMDDFGLLEWTKSVNYTFTFTGEVEGDEKLAGYLEDSSLILKIKNDLGKGNRQFDMDVNLMGSEVFHFYGEEMNGKIGFAFPSAEHKLYVGEGDSVFEKLGLKDDSINIRNTKENQKRAKKLLLRYGALLAKSMTKDNLTVEKKSCVLPDLETGESGYRYDGFVYHFEPDADEITAFIKKLAPLLEKDKECRTFFRESGLSKTLQDSLGMENKKSTDRLFSEFADTLRDRAEEIGESLAKNRFQWEVTMEGKTLRSIVIGEDRNRDGKIDSSTGEDWEFFYYQNCDIARNRVEYIGCEDSDQGTMFYLYNRYDDDMGKIFKGGFQIYTNKMDQVYTINYDITKGKNGSFLPYGRYDLGEDDDTVLTVEEGKGNSTDYELKTPEAFWYGLTGLKINGKTGADISRPGGQVIDITDYSLGEIRKISEEYIDQLNKSFYSFFNR